LRIAELLAPYGLSEREFALALARDLTRMPAAGASELTAEQESLLVEYGGMVASTRHEGDSVARATLGLASANLAEQVRTSLTVAQVAARLRINESQVQRRARSGGLYGFKIDTSMRLPLWQFEREAPIIGLRAILAALPDGLHPLEVAGFMLTPDPDLIVAGQATSPREWLSGGGDVAPVCELAANLDKW
jgi:hypothetical protein